MSTRTRLARLETQVQSNPALIRHSAETMQRAEIARQRLPDCTDPQEAENLIQGLPIDLYSALLRVVPDELLIAMHGLLETQARREGLIYGHTPEALRDLPTIRTAAPPSRNPGGRRTPGRQAEAAMSFTPR
ncbi:MAG: hypothetical protein JWN14_611 [Chthonomonadales bacterium]|nr:hypothetical protein [Chthonomonadales bacterium]